MKTKPTADRVEDAKKEMAAIEDFRTGKAPMRFAAEMVTMEELDEIYDAQQQKTLEEPTAENRETLRELFCMRRDLRYMRLEYRGLLRLGLISEYRRSYETGAAYLRIRKGGE